MKRGLNFVLRIDEEGIREIPLVTFHAENTSILDSLDEIARQTDLDYRFAKYAIEIGKPGDIPHPLPNRDFAVPPALFPDCTVKLRKGSELASYVRFDVRSRLSEWGITFPEGGAAYYFPADNSLLISNTTDALSALEMLVEEFVAEHPFPPEPVVEDTGIPGIGPRYGVRPSFGKPATANKLARIIFPMVEMREATRGEAFEFFFRKMRELDTLSVDEQRRGVAGGLSADIAADSGRSITLSLRNLPARDVLQYITAAAKLDFQIKEGGAILIENPQPGPKLEKRTYRVPREGIDVLAGSILGPDGVKYASVQELFAAFDVGFPPGASTGLTTDGEIVVLNTDRNLAIADVVVAALIDAKEKRFSPNEMAMLRSIIADAKEHGQIRWLTVLGFEG